MADTTTTNYSFVQPEIGGSTDTWGTKLNANWASVDSALKAVSDKADANETAVTANTAAIAALDFSATEITYSNIASGLAATDVQGAVDELAGVDASPAGAVSFFARNTAPDGWLKANGAAVSRTTYADLFTAIGTAFGAGDGSTTFNLPDLRGEFPRGWDDARGVDSGRAFGSAQLDALQNITGNIRLPHYANGATIPISTSGAFFRSSVGSAGGVQNTSVITSSYANFDASRIVRASSETRARNIALLACIKF